MALVSVSPDSNNGAAGWTATGGSLHGVLGDGSASTYIGSVFLPEKLTIGFPIPSVPSGAFRRMLIFQLRVARTTSGSLPGPGQIVGAIRNGSRRVPFQQTVSWTSPSEVAVGLIVPSSTQVGVSGLAIDLDVAANARIYEAKVSVVYATKPTLALSSPSGTLTTNNRPTVSWSAGLDQHGGEQARWCVRVYDAATHGAFGSVDPDTDAPFSESGMQSGADTSWRISRPLPDDDYRAFVRAAQWINGNAHWTDWTTIDFEVDVDRPGVPAVSLLGDDPFARISIEVTEVAGAAVTDWWEVQSSSDGVSGWQDLLTDEGGGKVTNPNPGSNGNEVVGDYMPGNNETWFYRARAVRDHGNDVTVASDWSPPVSASWKTPRLWWLKHRSSPGLNLGVSIASQPGWERQSRDGEFQGLGADVPVIVSDTPGPLRGTIEFDVYTDDDRESLTALYEQRDPVLIQKVPGGHWTDRWVRLLDHSRRPFVDKTQVDLTIDSFNWVEVSRPE